MKFDIDLTFSPLVVIVLYLLTLYIGPSGGVYAVCVCNETFMFDLFGVSHALCNETLHFSFWM